MRNILLITLLAVSFSVKSQTGSNTIFTTPEPGKTVKVIFDVSNYNSNHVGEFKDALIELNNTTLTAHYNDYQNLFTITYNDTIKITSLIEIFTEYNIDYIKKITPELEIK